MFSSPDFKVGLFFVVVTSIIAFMSIRVNQDPSFAKASKTVSFLIDDASGLVVNSGVKTSGISVGIIKSIQLENGLARVIVTLPNDVPLYRSAKVEIRASGILGDRHIELLPGNPRDGSLSDGDQILLVEDKGSLDALVNEVSKITQSINSVSSTLQRSLEGEGDRSSSLGRIVNNIENLSQDLSQISGENRDDLRNIVSKLSRVADSIDDFVNSQKDGSFQQGWDRVTRSLARIDTSLKNIEEITQKVNDGEGTIGRLINDESTVDELNTAIEGVSMIVGQAVFVETTVDFHTGYLRGADSGRSVLGLKFQPGLDRFYEVAIIDDSLGLISRSRVDQRVNGGASTVTETTDTSFSDIRLTALFAKNFYNFTVKGGLIESTGGVAFDYKPFGNNLLLSLQLFNLANTNASVFLRWNFLRSMYIIAGGYDLLDRSGFRSEYLGAGVTLTNDDFNLVLSALSF